MAQTFDYNFDELPLVIAPGIEAALINGRAEVEYSRDGEWQIKFFSISVEGHLSLSQEERAAGKKPWVYVTAPDSLAVIISQRLKHEWSDKVQDAVNEQIEEDRQCAADNYADMKRDERMLEQVR